MESLSTKSEERVISTFEWVVLPFTFLAASLAFPTATSLLFYLPYVNDILANPLIILLIAIGFIANGYTLFFTRKLVRADHDRLSTAIRVLCIGNFVLGAIGLYLIIAAIDAAISGA